MSQSVWVDCDEPHNFELYRQALVEQAGSGTFDKEVISNYADEVCSTSLEAYVPNSELKYIALQPTIETWDNIIDPDRVISCILFGDEPLVGRAR